MASSEPSKDVRPSVEELANFIRKDVLGRPKVMGIVNVTNDSFYKDSRYNQEQAIKAALEMWDLGVDWIDIGGESTRPGSKEISSEKELKRVIPIIKEIKSLIPNVLISIDTKKPDVAKEAINAGALMINDVSGLRNFYSYGSGFFSTEAITLELAKELKENKYDLVLVPVSNNHLEGFQNVLEVAQLIEPKNISLVYPEGQIEPYEDLPAYT